MIPILTEDDLEKILKRAGDQVSGTELYMDIITLVDEYKKLIKFLNKAGSPF